MNSYYSQDNNLGLYEYTLKVASENGNLDSVQKTFYEKTNGAIPLRTSSSGDADYLLTDSSNTFTTPLAFFRRQPLYVAFDYTNVMAGDIVWETETGTFDYGHNALIVDRARASFFGPYIQTIEAVQSGVKRGFLDDVRIVDYRCNILRVVGRTDDKARNAIYFANGQIGKPYSLNVYRLNTSVNSTEWYCSELVYAAWKHAGIDIGVRNGSYLTNGCLPADIGSSDNTYTIPMEFHDYLTVSIVKKANNTWYINVFNPTDELQTVNYNSKMCNFSDAKGWENLKDIKSLNIEGKSSGIIQISENWFATSIAVSYQVGRLRAITYADHLNQNCSLNTYNNLKTIPHA